MADTVKVRSVTVFEDSETGQWRSDGDEWSVSPSRAAELRANGLVAPEKAEKAAPPPAEEPADEPKAKGRR